MSLKKTLKAFDIDTFGWYDEVPYVWSTKDSKENPTLTNIRNFSQELWGLYIKNRTGFKFADQAEMYAASVHNAILTFVQHATNIINSEHRALTFDFYKSLVVRGFQDHATREVDSINTAYGDRTKWEWSDEELDTWIKRELPHRIKQSTDLFKSENDTVTLGNYLLRNPDEEVAEIVNGTALMTQRFDNYTYTDAITAIGLQTLETKGICLNIGVDGITNYMSHVDNINMTTVLEPGYRNPSAVVSECTLELWYGMCQQHSRTKILNSWPGWADIFQADDDTFGPMESDMARFVKNSSPYSSEMRRFVRGLLWNLRMPKDQHINLVPNKNFQDAYDVAKEWWPVITAASFDNFTHIAAITDFIANLHSVISVKEKIRAKKGKTPEPVGPDGHGITGGKPREGYKYLPKREGNGDHSVKVDPHTTINGHQTPKQNPMPLIMFTKPTKWKDLDTDELGCDLTPVTVDMSLDDYKKESLNAQHTRTKISEMISGSTWFVPLPPPGEHGQLQGQLDEGSLSNFAAFGDPHIFSTPPEQGRGHIAIGIVVDASGSMGCSATRFANGDFAEFNALQEVCSFLGGFRDAISRSANITMDAYAYHSDQPSRYAQNPHIEFEDSEYQSWLLAKDVKDNYINRWSAPSSCCIMRPLHTDDDLLYTAPAGATPTAEAISGMESRLRQQHPDATRFILVLTDGAPNDIPAVRTIVNSLDTPVFCVGINTSSESLKGQYNPGHYFLIESPEQVAKIACDLVQGIGQALNNA